MLCLHSREKSCAEWGQTVELKMFTDSDGQAIIPGMSVVPLDGIDHFMTAYRYVHKRKAIDTRLNTKSSYAQQDYSCYSTQFCIIKVSCDSMFIHRRSKSSSSRCVASKEQDLSKTTTSPDASLIDVSYVILRALRITISLGM